MVFVIGPLQASLGRLPINAEWRPWLRRSHPGPGGSSKPDSAEHLAIQLPARTQRCGPRPRWHGYVRRAGGTMPAWHPSTGPRASQECAPSRRLKEGKGQLAARVPRSQKRECLCRCFLEAVVRLQRPPADNRLRSGTAGRGCESKRQMR